MPLRDSQHDLDDLDDEQGSDSSSPSGDFEDRAAFLDDFPDEPELRPLVAAFVGGNYARLRLLVQNLDPDKTSPSTLAYAQDLIDRTKIDPTARLLLLLSGGFFFLVVLWVYFIHVH